MIIKRWNGSAFVEEFPKTKAQLVFNNGNSESIFDVNDQIKVKYLPSVVFDNLTFWGTKGGTYDLTALLYDMWDDLALWSQSIEFIRSQLMGKYIVQSSSGTLTAHPTTTQTVTNTSGTFYARTFLAPSDGGTNNSSATTDVLEAGDWLVITSVGGGNGGTSPNFVTVQFSAVNNVYETASTSVDGIVRLSSRSTYASLSGTNVVTESVLKTVIDNAAFASGTHVHGNITNDGKIGSTSDQVVVTGASGVLTTASRSGIDSRTEFTPASHTHGNITNAGAIGSTANLPLITTTSGVITTGTFGTTANTFTQGNDSRLSDARTPTSHVHGDISNAGAITSAAITPASGDYIILSDSSGSDVLKRGIAIGTSTTTYLRNDGTWVTPPDTNTTYSEATTTTLGLVELAFAKLGSSPALTETTTAGRYYGVSLNSNSQMQVNVPWTDTTYSAGEGITLSSTTFRMTNPLYVQTATPTTSVTGTIWYDIN